MHLTALFPQFRELRIDQVCAEAAGLTLIAATTARRVPWVASISLKAMAIAAALGPGSLGERVRSLTVVKVTSKELDLP